MIRLSAEQERILAVAGAIRYEHDSKQLRKDMLRAMRAAVEPAKAQIRSGLMAMGSSGLSTAPSLRAAVSSKLTVAARLSGDRAGVRVRIGKKGMPRGFVNAPKRLNSKKGWRHPVPARRLANGSQARQVWVHQVGAPDFFDRPLRERREVYRRAVVHAVEDMSQRIRTRGN